MPIDELIADAPADLDLRNASHLDAVDELTEAILDAHENPTSIAAFERQLASEDAPLSARLAAKVAQSRALAEAHPDSTRVTVVVAMYAEHERLRPASEHPHGEDALARKVSQLDRLLGDLPNWEWHLLLVDDGCPYGSGAVAEEIIRSNGWQDRVDVLYLQDGIDERSPGVGTLRTTDESRKGGSIQYGMWVAAHDDSPEHAIVFTDADLSTHLGQIGSLVVPLGEAETTISIGSRREPLSAVAKRGDRNARGKLFIYLWKQILGSLDGVTDTQCGFKAFPADRTRAWVEACREKQFAFDIELLLLAHDDGRGSIARMPVAWIDSDAASTTDDGAYLTMLQSVARMYRDHLPPNAASDEFADLVEELDAEAWLRLLANVPEDLLDLDPTEFDEHGAVVSAAELARRADRT